MKKLLLALLALLLTLAMVLSLAACGEDSKKKSNKDDDEKEDEGTSDVGENDEEEDDQPAQSPADLIIGSWKTTVDLSEALTEEVGMEVKGVTLDATLTFAKDGKITISGDVDKFVDALLDVIIDLGIEQSGMSKDEYMAALSEQGMDMAALKEYLEDTLSSQIAQITTAFDNAVGNYEIDGDTLIIDGEEMQFTVTASKLTLRYDGSALAGNPMEQLFNTTFTK